ncbi:MAG TPA: copper homeostasis protein CutC, partial [Fimbriimonadaceae bacterium]|nr:copper homeostasis protein CutC [Fimbriimonadaceae bacterium]
VKRRCRVPVMAMVRPRRSGFAYSQEDLDVMRRDVELFGEAGADGVVLGVLTASGEVEVAACRSLALLAGGMQKVFHRAFDVTPQPFEALETLIELGFTRILTSGQAPSALEGAETIRALIEQSKGRIEILPAGSVRADNVREFVRATGCSQVHLAPIVAGEDPSTRTHPRISFGVALDSREGAFGRVDETAVREVVAALRAA